MVLSTFRAAGPNTRSCHPRSERRGRRSDRQGFALAEGERARQLSLIIASDHGAVLYRARQYDRAIAQLRATLEMDPSFCHACWYLVISYVREGRFQEALDEVNRYVRPLSKPGALWGLAL